MSNEGTLKIEGTEVKVESESEWEESYFYDEYNQAFQITQRIINDNLDKELGENSNKKQNKDSNKNSKYKDVYKRQDIYRPGRKS